MPERSPTICRSASAAIAVLLLGTAPISGCATTRPMDEAALAAEPVAAQACTHVTLAAVGVPVSRPDGRSGLGAVRPVTCIRLPGGELLTAAHTLPAEHLGAGRVRTDPVTGALRVDRGGSDGEGAPLVFIVDDTIGTARVSDADPLRYTISPEASRESAAADWAVLTPESPTAWPTPVSRIGIARHGERCFMVGFPASMMDEGLFDAGPGVHRPGDLRWIGVAPVVLEGRVRSSGNDRILIDTDGELGAKAKGLSGGGVFVDRGGVPVLVGIAVQAARRGGEVVACPIPGAVRRRFD